MAQNTKKTSSSRSSGGKKTAPKAKAADQTAARRQIAGAVCLFAAFLMVLSFFNIDGFVLRFVKKVIKAKADELIEASGLKMKYMIGTMIETPRAAVTANEIAEEAEFFSFGTNDLTQMTYGFSRDDVGRILETYFEKKILESDPFARLDQNGVGKLIRYAVAEGRRTRPEIKLGICGEHGGDLSSVEFCHNVGLNYVSCSPFRVPIARLAAAQARVKELGKA